MLLVYGDGKANCKAVEIIKNAFGLGVKIHQTSDCAAGELICRHHTGIWIQNDIELVSSVSHAQLMRAIGANERATARGVAEVNRDSAGCFLRIADVCKV